MYKRREKASVVVPRVKAVVIRKRNVRLQSLDQRAMKLSSVLHSDERAPLARAVQIVRKNLECHQQTQQLRRASLCDRVEQDRAVDVAALVLDRLQCVRAQRRVGNRGGAGTPTGDLARRSRQSPGQLPRHGARERDRRVGG